MGTRLTLFLLISVCASLYGQNARQTDSMRLNDLDSLMGVQNNMEHFDSGIVYAKEFVSRTLAFYGSGKEYALSLRTLGYFYKSNFELSDAEDCDTKAISIFQKYKTKEDDIDYASLINNLASVYDDKGNYSKAESLYSEAVSIQKKNLADSSGYALGLNNLGLLYLKTQNYDLAKTNLSHALLIRKKLKDSLYCGQTLNSLGLVFQKTGNYATAESYYKEAFTILDSCCKDNNEIWDVRNNLASLYFEMNNYKAAEAIHQAVLEHLLDKFHRKITDFATTLGLLARDHSRAGEYDSALYFLHQASEIYLKELPDADMHPDFAINLRQIAHAFEKKGDLDSAMVYYQRVLEIRKQDFGTSAPVYAESLNDLGLVFMQKKDFVNAEMFLKNAAEIRLAKFGSNNTEYAESMNNLVLMYYTSHNYKQWSAMIDTSIGIWKNSTMHLLLLFSEREKQNYLDEHLYQRDLFLSMLWYFSQRQQTAAFHSSYFEMVTALQGWLLSGSVQLNKIIAQKKDTTLVVLFNKWLTVKNNYTSALEMSEAKRKDLHLDTDSLMQLAGDLEKSIIDKLPELQRSLERPSITPEKIAGLLKTDEGLANWVSFKYTSPEKLTDSIIYGAFIITSKKVEPDFVVAFEQKKLNTLLTNYFNYSGRGIKLKPKQINADIGRDSYKLIWEPVLPLLKDVRRLFIIPSGQLNKISFQSMEDSVHKDLLETMELHLLNNTGEINDPAVTLSKTKKTIDLFGGADFDRTIDGRTLRNPSYKKWPYLRGSADEVKQVALIFQQHQWNTKVYTGIAASEDNFKAQSGKKAPSILHIATHGFYEPAKILSVQNRNGHIYDQAPLLRSGFILSGANIYGEENTHSSTHNDGIVKAQEISDLNFSNTELLTLSACETALGDIDNNEGVYGLQRAFKIAGVKEMLITLWQIPDKETKELMKFFYGNIFKGDSYFTALRKAQLTMKRKYKDPAIWAAFELLGE